MNHFVHSSAFVEDGVKIGTGVKIWHFCHVRNGSSLGDNVSLGKDVFIDSGVHIGKGSRVQNGVSIYHGVEIENYSFVGPHVIFTNDQFPRAGNKAWKVVPTVLSTGSSIGAGAIIRCGITLGAFSMVGAGAIVSKSVEPFTLVVGVPAKPIGKVCACGQTKLPLRAKTKALVRECCSRNIEKEMYEMALNIQTNLLKKKKA